jgi:hypothetical protein
VRAPVDLGPLMITTGPIGTKQKLLESLDFEGRNSTRSVAIQILRIQVFKFSERRYSLKSSEFR